MLGGGRWFRDAASERPWKLLITLILTSVFFQSLKPSDPYLSHFFKDVKGFTVEQMSHYILPFYTYGSLTGLVPFTFVAEYIFDYHHVVFSGIVCRVVSQYLLLASSSLLTLQMAELTFGLASSTKIINGAFIYTLVPEDYFMRITGWLRAANLSANVLGGVVAWVLRRHYGLPYDYLFYISIVSTFTGLVLFAAVMPLRSEKRDRPQTVAARISRFGVQLKECRLLFSRNTSFLLWSIWIWVANTCAELVSNMDSALFKEVSNDDQTNGLVIAACRVAACAAAMASAKLGDFLQRHALYSVLAAATCAGSLLIVAAHSVNVQTTHACIILFYAVQEISGCVATSQVARNTTESVRLLLLFFNMFLSQVLQSMSHIILGPDLLNFAIREKFSLLSTMMYLLAAGVIIAGMAKKRKKSADVQDTTLKSIHS